MSFSVDELALPDDVETPEADDFRALVDVRNAVEVGVLGSGALAMSPAELLPIFRTTSHRTRRHFVARADGRIVGRGIIGWLKNPDAPAASLNVDVLESHRGRGIGTALLKVLEDEAAALGRTVVQSQLIHSTLEGGERVPSPTGFGDLPAADPGVRFLRNNGYDLEMVVRVSCLDLGAAPTIPDSEYGLVTWAGDTPTEWLEDIASLKTTMAVEEPTAGMESVEDSWDAERVRQRDEIQSASGRPLLTAAAQDKASGRLVAYTEASLGPDRAGAAVQEDTLVMPGHRGHGLGMLVKAANSHQISEVAPGATDVLTFNAEDNVPMLRVNEALGFRAIGLEGAWQKRLRE